MLSKFMSWLDSLIHQQINGSIATIIAMVISIVVLAFSIPITMMLLFAVIVMVAFISIPFVVILCICWLFGCKIPFKKNGHQGYYTYFTWSPSQNEISE